MQYISLFIWAVLLTGAAICEVKYARLSSTVTLSCKPGVSWKFGKSNITSNGTYEVKKDTLLIKNVGTGQFGTYTCNNKTSIVRSITLEKGIEPTIVTFEEVPSIPENENLLLNCSIKGIPKVTAEWFKNGNKIENGTQESSGVNNVTTTSLRINSIKLENSGNYSCRGWNQFGNANKTTDVTVHATLKFSVKPESQYNVIKGKTLMANCSARAASAVIWKIKGSTKWKDSRISQSSHTKKGNTVTGTLKITNVNHSDAGNITCEAHDTYSNISEMSQVFVYELPGNVRTLKVERITANSIKVTWEKPVNDGGSIYLDYIVTYNKNEMETAKENITKQLFITLDQLEPSTKYNIAVKAKNPVGESVPTKTNAATANMPSLGTFTLSAKNITSKSVVLRWNRTQRLNSTWQDRQIFVQIESKLGLRNLSFPSVIGMGNMGLLMNLSPYTEYNFTLREVAGNFTGNSTSVSANTSEDAPSQPTNLVPTTGKNFINLTWYVPNSPNGVIRKYEVKYRPITNGCEEDYLKKYTNASDTSVELTDLYSNIEYEIEVRAETVVYGNGTVIRQRTHVDHFSMCLQDLDPGNVTFNMQITEVNSTKVNISWNDLPVCSQGADGLGYELEVKHVVSNVTFKNYTNTTSYILIQFCQYQTYEIIITPTNKQGQGEPSKMTFTTPEGIPTAPFQPSVKQTGKNQNVLEISWKRPLCMNGEPLQYQIEFRKIKSCTSHDCKRSIQLSEPVNITGPSVPLLEDQNITVTVVIKQELELYYFSKYEVKVRESTMKGWGPYSSKLLFKIGEGESSKPLNLTWKSVSHDTATIEWEEPKYPNGIIKSYELLKWRGNSGFVRLEINIVGKHIRYTINHLDSETTYFILIYAVNGYGRGYRSEQLVFTTSAAPPEFPWIFVLIGCLTVILVIVLIITVVLLLGRRKKLQQYRGVQTVEEIDMNSFVQSKPINVTELKQYCAQRHANSDFQFQQEFESLRMLPTHGFTFEHSQMPYNQTKNRYSNILAYDHSRVILSTIENEVGSTYINGNFIDGYQHPKKYIATQGPLPETVLDFWRMVWEQKVPVIVMLTKLLEDNRLKCEQYWPPDTGLQYKDIVVKVISVNEITDYTVRIFEIYKVNNPDQNRRIVRHYHYTAWPDHGVPSHPTSMLSFIRHVVSYVDVTRLTVNEAKKLDGPVIVHCSAGVGRTGTFIAIEGCLRQMEQDKRVDIFGTVCQMRRQRNFMVQTESQYTFIYDALLDSYICGNTEIAPGDLVAKMRFLNEKDPSTGDTNFVGEFKRLESGITIKDKDYYVDAGHQENKQKNRFLNILPYDKNRVKLVPIAGCRQSDYINASLTDGFQKRNAFIATQAPLENTVNDFWRMIVEQNVHIIVMLTKLEEKGQEKCYLYWPQASTVSYGNVLVGFIDFKQEDNVVIRQLRITNKESQKSWTVTHFMYLGWPDYGSPESGTEIIQMIGLVERKQRDIQNNSGPILVHCSGGVGRTGVFISVFNSIERLKAKDVVDVFQTTRALRLQRTAMVQTIDQYIFCYQALKDYLDSFDLYANPQC